MQLPFYNSGGWWLEVYIRMEENISYRRINQLKPHGIRTTSHKLLQPIFRNRESKQRHPHNNDIMSQNVTQYQYMLSDPHLKQNYINWATNLRAYQQIITK